jgi:SAM-dependent methyltransferase
VVHDIAAEGFNDPADYERARPSYPPEAVQWFVDRLHIAPGMTLVDLAAGTGKFTRLLTPFNARLFACEPVPGMRATFQTVLPTVALFAGTSEAMPLRDASVDGVTVAQAWHWFDHDRAAAEMARVIRPGGALGLVWNARDRSIDWVDQVWSVMDRVEKKAPWRDHDRWGDTALASERWFGPLHEAVFHHAQVLSPDLVVDRFRGVSHVAALPSDEQTAVLDEVRAILTTHPDTVGRAELALPYRVDAYWCERP